MDLLTTLDELIKEEENRTKNARDRLGTFVLLAQDALTILNTFVVSINRDSYLPAALLFSIEKVCALAYLSYIRGHIAQAEVNARQAIEFTALTAYLIAHPDVDVTAGPQSEKSGFVRPKVLSSKAYKWLDKELDRHSKLLLEFKEMINESVAHASVYMTHFTFEYASGGEDREQFRGSFFDNVDDDVFRLYLASFARVILIIVETLRLIANKYGAFAIDPDLERKLAMLERGIDEHRKSIGARMRLKSAP